MAAFIHCNNNNSEGNKVILTFCLCGYAAGIGILSQGYHSQQSIHHAQVISIFHPLQRQSLKQFTDPLNATYVGIPPLRLQRLDL